MVKRSQKLAVHRETVHRLDEIKAEEVRKVRGGDESSCFLPDCAGSGLVDV